MREVKKVTTTCRKLLIDTIFGNLLAAQKNMASAEKVDAKGLILLSRFILRILKQLDDEIIERQTETMIETTDWGGNVTIVTEEN